MKDIDLTKEKIENISKNVTSQIKKEEYLIAVSKLSVILKSKVPFSKLDKIGVSIGKALIKDYQKISKFVDQLVKTDAMGSYVIASSALRPQIKKNLDAMLTQTKEIIIKGDVWHVCDNVSERTLGPALVQDFDKTLPHLHSFLSDNNLWIKRSAGVAIHFFNKRVRDRKDLSLKLLLAVEPYIEMKQKDVVKGIGWGIKTTGKYHPQITTDFLVKQLKADKKLSKLLIRKALTYLPAKNKAEIQKYV